MNVIGKSEVFCFPKLKIKSVVGKIDTGAFGTSIRAGGIKEKNKKLYFWVGNRTNTFVYSDYKMVKVKSSFGHIQKRYTIKIEISLGDSKYNIHVMLSDRSKMPFKYLIGRNFLKKSGYIVDVSKQFLISNK